jgi:hypothetical protein
MMLDHRDFSADMYCSPYRDGWAIIEYTCLAIFAIDILLKFLLAYSCPEQGLEIRHSKIAMHYLRYAWQLNRS